MSLRLSELFFLFAGIGILASLPFLAGEELYVWIAAKVVYVVGVWFYMWEFVWKPH